RNDPTNNTLVRLYGTVTPDSGATFEPDVMISHATPPNPENPANGTIVNVQQYGVPTGIGSDGKSMSDSHQHWRLNQWGIGDYPDHVLAFEDYVIGGSNGPVSGLIKGNSDITLALSDYRYFDYVPTGSLQYTIGPMYGAALGEYTAVDF